MINQLKNILGVLIAILLVGAILFIGIEVKNRLKTPIDLSKTRSVTMSAEGKVTAKPDTASLSFSVVTQGKEATKVQEENDKKMKTVTDFLKSQGIKDEDIKTSNYNLYPQYDYNLRYDAEGKSLPPTIIGYTLTQTVTAKVRELEKVPGIISSLTAKGVNQIDAVSYFIDDPDGLKAEARAQAVDKAKGKAQELALKLGVKLGRVINFSEGESYYPTALMDKNYGVGGGAGVSPTEPGTQDVTVNVTLTFELK
jgi:hypothetical protein